MKMLPDRGFRAALAMISRGLSMPSAQARLGSAQGGEEAVGVATIAAAGAFAEFVIAEEKNTVLKPRSLSFKQAAALMVVAVTAWNGIVLRAKVSPSQSIFIAGCLGGVGSAAVEIARLRGARVTGSCRTVGREEALALGASVVIDYRDFDCAKYRSRFVAVFDTAGIVVQPMWGDAKAGWPITAYRPHVRKDDPQPALVAASLGSW